MHVPELVDRHEIEQLIYAYCRHFDQNEPEAVAALFTDDAVVDYGPEFPNIVGAASIAETIAVGLEQTVRRDEPPRLEHPAHLRRPRPCHGRDVSLCVA